MKEGKVIEDLRSVVFKESQSLEGTCAKIQGYDFNHGINYPDLLKSLVSTGFQASNLGDAIETVNQMVSSLLLVLLDSTYFLECVVFFLPEFLYALLWSLKLIGNFIGLQSNKFVLEFSWVQMLNWCLFIELI